MNQVSETNRHIKRSVLIADGIILLVIFGIALSIRIVPVYRIVFGQDWINFQGNDTWYHIRLIENLLQHFPHRISFDPYTYFPYGQAVFFAPFFDLLVGFFAWVAGLGAPSTHTIEVVAAYIPPIMGALVAIPVYFIGKELFNKTAGWIAALLVGILPSPLLMHSRLGFVDHHVAEILFSTIAILFLILTIKNVRANPLEFRHLRTGAWKSRIKPLIFAICTGVVLGIYLLTWVGGLLTVFIIFFWLVVMYIFHHLRQENTDYLCITGVLVFLIPLLMIIPFLDQIAYGGLNVIALIIAVIAIPIFSGISRLLSAGKIRAFYFPVALAGLGVLGIAGIYLIDVNLFRTMLDKFRIFTPDTTYQTISEARPLFFARGPFSLSPVWDIFTTGMIMAPISFVIILVSFLRKMLPEIILFLTWSLLIFLAAMGQIRFAEYLTVPVAILSGYLCWQITSHIPAFLKWLEFRSPQEMTEKKAKTARKKKDKTPAPRKRYIIWYSTAHASLALVLVFLLGVLPNISPAGRVLKANAGITPDWQAALVWLRQNTPEPFGDAGFFNAVYQKPAEGQRYPYPDSAYGVMTWWTRGHMITQIAHRIPNSNPHQSGAAAAASFFIEQDVTIASRVLDQWGSKYVIVDYDMAMPFDAHYVTMGFPPMVTWAGKELSQYCDIYYQNVNGVLKAVTLYYPDYYRTMTVRLFSFGGEEVIPANSTLVISYTVQSGHRVIQTSQMFHTYGEAEAFISQQKSTNYLIVGTSPFVSPVPLEKLAKYEQVYQSDVTVARDSEGKTFPSLRIFRYLP